MEFYEDIIESEKYIPMAYLDYKLTPWGRMISDISNKESFSSNYAVIYKSGNFNEIIKEIEEYYNSKDITPKVFYRHGSIELNVVRPYFENKVLDSSRIFFAVCLNEKIIGEIQIKRIDMERLCGTLSIHLINDAYKGKGYGTEAQRLLIEYAINVLGLKTIYADAVHRNYRSKYILEKLGFEYIFDDDVLAYYILETNKSLY